VRARKRLKSGSKRAPEWRSRNTQVAGKRALRQFDSLEGRKKGTERDGGDQVEYGLHWLSTLQKKKKTLLFSGTQYWEGKMWGGGRGFIAATCERGEGKKNTVGGTACLTATNGEGNGRKGGKKRGTCPLRGNCRDYRPRILRKRGEGKIGNEGGESIVLCGTAVKPSKRKLSKFSPPEEK